jgi:basic membrane protein A
MAHDVFVSYSTKDKVVADTIVSNLENNNIRCWYTPRDIKPGMDWGKAITDAIKSSKVLLIVFSGHANKSQRVLDELNFAISKEVTILPFRIENLEPRDAMMLHLSSRHWLDAYDPSWDKYLNKLIKTVASNLDISIADEKIEIPKIKKGKRTTLWIGAGLAAVLAVIYLFSSANNLPPESTPTPMSDIKSVPALSPAIKETKICYVLDIYAFEGNDNDSILNYNAPGWAGMQRAANDFSVEIKYLESQQESDYEKNFNTFINEDCDLIVTSWPAEAATTAAAAANPNQKFAITGAVVLSSQPNVRGGPVQIDQATFLSGYLAAGMSQTGKVATYAGMLVPGTQIWMDGFAMGVKHYNEVNGSNVELLGWDMETEQGLSDVGYDDLDVGRATAKALMNDGADIIMPVAGNTGLGSLDYIAELGRGLIIGADVDWSDQLPDKADYVLSSALKNFDVFVYDSIKHVVDGDFKGGENYSLTLENGGTSMVYGSVWKNKPPWEDDTFAKLRIEIEELIPKIISGEIKTNPVR